MNGPYGPWQGMVNRSSTGPMPDAPEEPSYDLPRWYAEDIGSTKQVVSGPGYIYYKKSRVPEYIDTLSEPYARFVFKYRTKDEIKKEINIDIDLEIDPDQTAIELQRLDKQDEKSKVAVRIRVAGPGHYFIIVSRARLFFSPLRSSPTYCLDLVSSE